MQRLWLIALISVFFFNYNRWQCASLICAVHVPPVDTCIKNNVQFEKQQTGNMHFIQSYLQFHLFIDKYMKLKIHDLTFPFIAMIQNDRSRQFGNAYLALEEMWSSSL